jgi:hypothetical protein
VVDGCWPIYQSVEVKRSGNSFKAVGLVGSDKRERKVGIIVFLSFRSSLIERL